MAEPEAGERVRAFIASQDVLNARIFVAPPGLTIGDHRNLAATRAQGAIAVNWDDDDLSDPQRIAISVKVLRETGTAAAFLSRLLVWWPQQKVQQLPRVGFGNRPSRSGGATCPSMRRCRVVATP